VTLLAPIVSGIFRLDNPISPDHTIRILNDLKSILTIFRALFIPLRADYIRIFFKKNCKQNALFGSY